MDCDRSRAAISAALDGEELGIADEALRSHVASCAGCRDFASGAERLHRVARVAPAEPVPDLSDTILRAIGGEPVSAAVDERTRFLRISLAVIAVIQLGMAIPALVLGDDAGLPTHVARHLGSFSLALGVGLLVVAWRPDRAAGVLPVIAAVVVCLIASSIIDIVSGRAAPGAEVSHAPELVGLVAVWLLARGPGETARHHARPVLG
ncbi:MAG: zf-HC2 domain-containing protein [Acidimicrobiia bacterium]